MVAAMSQEKILKFNLDYVDQPLLGEERNWKKIDDELDLKRIWRCDVQFYPLSEAE
jgi:hypothetical protein